MRRTLQAVFTATLLTIPLGAQAGGSWLETTENEYEPGDEVVAVGYVGANQSEGTEVFAFLTPRPVATITEENQWSQLEWIDLGPVKIEPSGLQGYLSSRVSITFTLPDDLTPGVYEVAVRDANGDYFGDLIGAMIHVGVVADYPKYVEWPVDEPLIAQLPDDAVISGPGFTIPVTELWAGNIPQGLDEFTLANAASVPEIQPSPPATEPSLATSETPVELADQPTAQEPQTSERSFALPLVIGVGAALMTLSLIRLRGARGRRSTDEEDRTEQVRIVV